MILKALVHQKYPKMIQVTHKAYFTLASQAPAQFLVPFYDTSFSTAYVRICDLTPGPRHAAGTWATRASSLQCLPWAKLAGPLGHGATDQGATYSSGVTGPRLFLV